MKSRLFFRRLRRASLLVFGGLVLTSWAVPSAPPVDVPDWLLRAAQDTLPTYKEETDAVLLLDETEVTVTDKGEIRTRRRTAYKVLRPQGRHVATPTTYFDKETPITYLKAWSIPPQGKPYEVKEKDAIEVGQFDDLYSDVRTKTLVIPGVDPGSVIGYEVEQRDRPYLLQATWAFQDYDHPVRRSRFTLRLPAGWEFKERWVNAEARPPVSSGERTSTWEVTDIAPVEPEPEMPSPRAFEGRMTVLLFPSDQALRSKVADDWKGLGDFYRLLAQGRRTATPEIQAKVSELTSGKPSAWEKMQVLSNFAQKDIRYVSIQIGIGGYQPHFAGEVFKSRYGDCKDKATLLSTMLKEIGVDSLYVLVHTDRGFIRPDTPPAITFNHAILAIQVPKDVPPEKLHGVYRHPQLGALLFFDPTDSVTPLGDLSNYLQGGYGLLATEQGGELIPLPVQAPETNRLKRTAKLELSSAGILSGEVEEVRRGDPAVTRRGALLRAEGADRAKVLEDFLSSFLEGFHLTGASVENLEEINRDLVLRYRFVANNYGKKAGNLLLLRPRVLGQKSSTLLERKERKHPYDFDSVTLQEDVFEIKLPAGYKVDELPGPVEVKYDFAEYRSRVEVAGQTLRYLREYRVNEMIVPTGRLDDLKKFYRAVAADEKSNVVLQRAVP